MLLGNVEIDKETIHGFSFLAGLAAGWGTYTIRNGTRYFSFVDGILNVTKKYNLNLKSYKKGSRKLVYIGKLPKIFITEYFIRGLAINIINRYLSIGGVYPFPNISYPTHLHFTHSSHILDEFENVKVGDDSVAYHLLTKIGNAKILDLSVLEDDELKYLHTLVQFDKYKEEVGV